MKKNIQDAIHIKKIHAGTQRVLYTLCPSWCVHAPQIATRGTRTISNDSKHSEIDWTVLIADACG